MAIKPKDNEAFYREVDEEVRRAQLTGYWHRYGKAMIVGVVLLLAGLGGFLYWQHNQKVAAGKNGEAMIAVFDDIQAGRRKEAGAKLDRLAKSDSIGYQAVATLTKADLAIDAGNQDAAIAAFRTVADDPDLPEAYRNLALVRMTALQFDTLDPDVVISRLRPLAKAGNPWFGSAGEMVAIAHIKQNKPQLAAPIFAALAKDEAVPESLRSRAVQMAGSLGVDAIQEPANPVKE
ncbi:tetratricopeptide repeat protein [Sphingosinicella rhizophila]|uniref:Ancillary SecYEG translocon subunit n=1 Tax=Sphingosinicella rhizophila TaxID=3050082 RepID=A0ABU3Q3N0_9SPHN|nr:tetratricopeptide repeat protein [Sphingosinicella sp. GR2756]MDT9598025.1 tetratricopeptide repeat protein [Sphingosinicella sp. GR2756]